MSKHNRTYESAKLRATSHKDQLDKIANLEERLRGLTKLITEKEQTLLSLGEPEIPYQETREEWMTIYKTRGELLEAECQKLTEKSDGRIRATLQKGAGLEKAMIQLENILTGTRIRTKKVADLCDIIRKAKSPVDKWIEALGEFEIIAHFEITTESEEELPPLPLLSRSGFADIDIRRLAQKLSVDKWIELSLVELEDQTVFEYQQREGAYINFSNASAGQQATVLLKVLLKQVGPPLVIDQPEEDLDNQVILEVVKDIWSAKAKRQIVFSSHNANIVVNGDADLVAVCDYRTAGDQSGGRIRSLGAIDVEEIRNSITTIMEGGREAFKLRKEKYGF